MPEVARVLFASTIGDVGGAESCLLRLMAALDRRRFEPLLACPDGGALAREARALGVSVHPLAVPAMLDPDAAYELAPADLGLQPRSKARRAATLAANVLRSLGATPRMTALLRREAVALVAANSPRAALVVGPAARLGGRRVLVHVRDIVLSPFARPLRRRVLAALCDRAVAASQATAGVIGDALPTDVVYDGLPESQLRPAARARTPPAGRLAMVAAMSPWKGHDVLLRAMPRVLAVHAEARLAIYGGDWGRGALVAYRRGLERIIAELGLGHAVTLAGAQPDIPRRLAECDVLVHPPTRPDPFPAAVIEGAVAGCAIVASRTGGIPEIVEHGSSAVLVTPGDVTALAEAIVALLDDPARAARLGLEAQRRVQRFTLARQAEAMAGIYEAMIAAR